MMINITNFLAEPLEKTRYKETWDTRDWSWESDMHGSECHIGFRSSAHLREMGENCKTIKENKKDSHNSLKKLLEVKLDIGVLVILPFSLIHISDVINESKRILDLEDDWDHDCAIKISQETWQSSCMFLINYSKYILKNFGVTIQAPEINPSANGSIDLVWRTKSARLLMNIKPSGSAIFGSYYGDLNENNQAIKNVIEKPILIEHLAFWMRNLS